MASFETEVMDLVEALAQATGRNGVALRPRTPYLGEGIPVRVVPWADKDTAHGGADAMYLAWRGDPGPVAAVLVYDGRTSHGVLELETFEIADGGEVLIVHIISKGHALGYPTSVNLVFDLNELGL